MAECGKCEYAKESALYIIPNERICTCRKSGHYECFVKTNRQACEKFQGEEAAGLKNITHYMDRFMRKN